MGACQRKSDFKKSNQSPIFKTQEDEKRFCLGKTAKLQNGIFVKLNLQTKQIEGIPLEWNEKFPEGWDRPKERFSPQKKQILKQDRSQFPASIIFFLRKKISQGAIKVEARKQTENELQNNVINNQSQMRSVHSITTHGSVIRSNSFCDKENDQILSRYSKDSKSRGPHYSLISNLEWQEKMNQASFFNYHPCLEYTFLEEIGRGAICHVYKAQKRGKAGNFYAVRVFKEKMKENLEKVKMEIAIMQFCKSSNIVDYHFTFFHRELLFMFVEYMNAGCLTRLIEKKKGEIPQKIMAYILREALKGLFQIHQCHQIHRDIKSDNILLNSEGEVKISDFGFATQLTIQKLTVKGLAGTTQWMAPELIRKEEYNQLVDIWSIGILTIQLCKGQPPHLELPAMKVMQIISEEQPPKIEGVSKQLTNFVESCLKKNPGQRPTAKELLKHPFITQIGKGRKQKEELRKILSQK